MILHEPGTTLDGRRYRILELVGKGGMGAVYKARDTRLTEKVVAIKQVLDEADDVDPEFAKKQLKVESDTLEKLRHPGIPQVMDAFREGNANHIVMEFVEGTSLDKLLDHFLGLGSPMPQEMVVDLALKICDIMIYLHEQSPPILHRDIKPQNVLVREHNQEVVLVDFGLARKSSGSITENLVGTLGYAPLEQFKGAPEERSDIYSLGATMHHLISGRPPVPFSIRPLQQDFPKVHPALALVVDRCCQEKPERRFGNAQAVKTALKKALGEMTGIFEDHPVPASSGDALSIPPNQPMPAGLFAILALCLLLGGGGLLFGLYHVKQQQQQRPPQATQSAPPAPPPVGTRENPERITMPAAGVDFQPRRRADTPVALSDPGPELAGSAPNWFQSGSRGAWTLVGCSNLGPDGSLTAEAGKPAAAAFQRTAQGPPRRFSVHVRRQQPCDVQLQVGDLIILSQHDPTSQQYGTQILRPGGGASDLLLQSEREGADSTYAMDLLSDGTYLLAADGGKQVRFGSGPINDWKGMAILLAAPDQGSVTIDVGNIETE